MASSNNTSRKDKQETAALRQRASDSARPSAAASGQPVTFSARISDQEAGIDASGLPKVYKQIKGPKSRYQSTSGAVQTFDATGSASANPDLLRQAHKEASIGVQVPNPETTGDAVATMVKEVGGYVAANNLSTGDDGLKSLKMTVKVPVTQFEPFLAQVAKLGSVQSKNITGEDITEKTSRRRQAMPIRPKACWRTMPRSRK